MFNFASRNRGFVQTIILVVVALIILGYFGFNLREIVNSPIVSDNLKYGGEVASSIWTNYLRQPLTFIWNEIIVKLILQAQHKS